jgi:hypothetical protein
LAFIDPLHLKSGFAVNFKRAKIMVSKVDCSNLSIILNLMVSKARLGLKHMNWEICLVREEFHGDD